MSISQQDFLGAQAGINIIDPQGKFWKIEHVSNDRPFPVLTIICPDQKVIQAAYCPAVGKIFKLNGRGTVGDEFTELNSSQTHMEKN